MTIRIEIPSNWVNWVHQRGLMFPSHLIKTYGGIKFPILKAIADADFDISEIKTISFIENRDEFPKTYLEFPDENCAVLFRLKLSNLWESEIVYDDRNR
jgi:hypothetical protein